MITIFRRLWFVATIVVIMWLSVPAYSQGSTVTISGEIISIDLKNSTVGINELKDPRSFFYDEDYIIITPAVKLTKDRREIEVADLKIRDKVKVDYEVSSYGELKPIGISVEK